MLKFENDAVKKEVTELLSQLIRIDTSNPPGNETAAAEFIRDLLFAEGLKAEIIESAPGRGSLVTRIPGKGERKSVLLMSHLDVVPASQEGWDHPPFAGVVDKGSVYGRGAWDCKGMVASEVVALLLLLREGFEPKGDLILALWADEEKGGNMGAGWLMKHRPELVQADFVINEGGGYSLPIAGRNHYAIQVAEKGVFWTKLITRGTPGHASMPHRDNALLKMSTYLAKLGSLKTPIKQSEIVGQYISKRLASTGLTAHGKLQVDDPFLMQLEKSDATLAAEANTLVRMTIAPTMIQAGTKENIIPERCEAVIDCRLLPGQTAEDLRQTMAEAIGGLEEVEIEPIQADEGTVSPLNTDLYKTIGQIMEELDPGCRCIPYMDSGGTDSRFFRQKGITAYGFFPLSPDIPLSELLSIVHGRNERISQKSLLLGTKFFYQLVKKMLG